MFISWTSRHAPVPRKRTTLIAAVPNAGGSPRRYYVIGDESAEDIASRIVADMGIDRSDDEAAIPRGK